MQAYLQLLINTGRNELPADSNQGNFRVGKFFNDVPSYSRNKTGLNVQILVLHVMHFIVKGKHDKVIDRAEALERYCSRHLRKNEYLRSNCFFKIINAAIKSNFHRVATERRTAKLYERMTSEEAIRLSFVGEWEMIPFEVLYDILLDQLYQPQLRRQNK